MTRWRTGRKVFRTIYDADNKLIGMMDTPELATQVVEAVNFWCVVVEVLSTEEPDDALVDAAEALLKAAVAAHKKEKSRG